MLQGLSKEGPLLVLDAGNALFKDALLGDDAAKKRAAFVLATMAKLDTKLLVAGQRDLTAGVEFLKSTAAKHGVTVLSSNLRHDGVAPFPGSAIREVGGVKVAFVGVTAVGRVPGQKGATCGPTLAAVKQELSTLGQRDLTVVLAATSYADALQLATELKGQVDFVIQSGEARGAQPPQAVGEVWVLASGQKGQAVAKLQLDLSGAGPFVDLDQQAREKATLDYLDAQLKRVDERLKLAQDVKAKAELQKIAAEMRQRRDAQAKKAGVGAVEGARSLKLSWVILGAEHPADAALEKEVLAIEPTPPAH